jgi:hypothetical protein
VFLIIGTKYHYTGSEQTPQQHRCERCGVLTQFITKTGRNYLTLFFVLPLFPVGKAHPVLECPNCGARHQANNF